MKPLDMLGNSSAMRSPSHLPRGTQISIDPQEGRILRSLAERCTGKRKIRVRIVCAILNTHTHIHTSHAQNTHAHISHTHTHTQNTHSHLFHTHTQTPHKQTAHTQTHTIHTHIYIPPTHTHHSRKHIAPNTRGVYKHTRGIVTMGLCVHDGNGGD